MEKRLSLAPYEATRPAVHQRKDILTVHYYKFNIADWALATSHLSLEEEAIYFRLVNHYYDTEAAIPLETQSVFRRLRIGSDSVIALQILEEFFTKTEKGYTHDRCDALLKEYRKTAKTSRANGAKGGRPRNDAAHSETQDKPSGLLKETQPKPRHNLNQEPLTINQEPINNNKKDGQQVDLDAEFERFWESGIKKTKKVDAKAKFKKILSGKTKKVEFTDYLINDIRWRLDNHQFGFSELHPTSYLNGERWTDERVSSTPKSSDFQESIHQRPDLLSIARNQ